MPPVRGEARADAGEFERRAQERFLERPATRVVELAGAICAGEAHREIFLAIVGETRGQNIAIAQFAAFAIHLFVHDLELVAGMDVAREVVS